MHLGVNCLPNSFSLAEILVLGGTAGASGMAPPTSARMSARLKRAQGHSSSVIVAWPHMLSQLRTKYQTLRALGGLMSYRKNLSCDWATKPPYCAAFQRKISRFGSTFTGQLFQAHAEALRVYVTVGRADHEREYAAHVVWLLLISESR